MTCCIEGPASFGNGPVQLGSGGSVSWGWGPGLGGVEGPLYFPGASQRSVSLLSSVQWGSMRTDCSRVHCVGGSGQSTEEAECLVTRKAPP